MSRHDGIKLIAIYHFVLAGIMVLGALGILLFPLLAVSVSPVDPRGPLAVLFGTGIIFFILIVLAILYLIAGIGLWQRQEWARWLTIVLAILGLFNFPVGTIIGLVILWFLLRDDVQALFRTPDHRHE